MTLQMYSVNDSQKISKGVTPDFIFFNCNRGDNSIHRR